MEQCQFAEIGFALQQRGDLPHAGQRAFMALRSLLDGKSIACSFKHVTVPPKAVCLVGDRDVTQFLLSQGWAELAEGVTEVTYVEAVASGESKKSGIWGDGPP